MISIRVNDHHEQGYGRPYDDDDDLCISVHRGGVSVDVYPEAVSWCQTVLCI